jgi:hypothetical protein
MILNNVIKKYLKKKVVFACQFERILCVWQLIYLIFVSFLKNGDENIKISILEMEEMKAD